MYNNSWRTHSVIAFAECLKKFTLVLNSKNLIETLLASWIKSVNWPCRWNAVVDSLSDRRSYVYDMSNVFSLRRPHFHQLCSFSGDQTKSHDVCFHDLPEIFGVVVLQDETSDHTVGVVDQ